MVYACFASPPPSAFRPARYRSKCSLLKCLHAPTEGKKLSAGCACFLFLFCFLYRYVGVCVDGCGMVCVLCVPATS
ncbi:hypothetical protein LX36DRAFT_111396 [Colletotrichum falcatum]|nr:hypothetical protein LX36DRAFT_111396 [Colletotrichum falcatum]